MLVCDVGATCPNPLFIVGAPRSGTSALAWALAQHSAFWTSSESDFLVYLFGNGRAEAAFDLARAMPNSWLARQQVDLAEFLEHLGYGVNALFTSRSHGKRWIDKAPAYSSMMDLLGMMFPAASFIHIVRDGPSVVNSMLNSGFNELWATDFKEACRTWSACVESALEFGESFPDRCITVRHEALTDSPEAVLESIFAFVGVPPEPASARFIRENRINSSFASPEHGAQRGSVFPGTWSKWSPAERGTFQTEAGGAAEKFRL